MSTITKAPESGRHRQGKPAKPAKANKPAKPAKAPAAVAVLDEVPVDVEALAPEATHEVAEQAAPRARRADRGRRRPLLRLIALMTIVAITIASAAVAFFVHRSNSHTRSLRAVETAREQAVSAATQDVPKILGYDYRKLSADIKGAKALATGQFLTDYSTTAQKVLASAPSVKAVVTASVADVSVVQAQSDRVTLLLFVDQESVKQLSGQKTATTRIDPFRVQITMSKLKGRWMVSDLEPI